MCRSVGYRAVIVAVPPVTVSCAAVRAAEVCEPLAISPDVSTESATEDCDRATATRRDEKRPDVLRKRNNQPMQRAEDSLGGLIRLDDLLRRRDDHLVTFQMPVAWFSAATA